MHQTTVAKIERGARPLRLAEAVALTEVFEMPVSAVLGLSMPEDRSPEHTTMQLQIEDARRRLDTSRDNLHNVAKQHAQLLVELDKLILQLGQHHSGRGLE